MALDRLSTDAIVIQHLYGRTDEEGHRKLSGWNFSWREVVGANDQRFANDQAQQTQRIMVDC